MRKTTVLLPLSLALCFMLGCHADPPQAPAATQKTSTTQQSTNANPDPANTDCVTISDPAKAEDCRLWKRVAEAKKKSNSNNVVGHSPGSIQQP